MDGMILISIALPAIAGILLLLNSFMEHLKASGTIGKEPVVKKTTEEQLRSLHIFTGIIMAVSAGLTMATAWTGSRSLKLFVLLDEIPVYFQIDEISKLFATIVTIIWLLAGFYAFVYMKHEKNEKRYFALKSVSDTTEDI